MNERRGNLHESNIIFQHIEENYNKCNVKIEDFMRIIWYYNRGIDIFTPFWVDSHLLVGPDAPCS